MKNLFKFYRNKRGLIQEQMANLLSVSRQSYINYETGEAEPSFETLIKISKTLRTPIDDLLGNEKYPSDRDLVKEQFISEIETIIKKYK